MSKKKVKLEILDGCNGCQTCNFLCDHIFNIDANGKAYVDMNKDYMVEASELESVITLCPVGIIIEKEQN